MILDWSIGRRAAQAVFVALALLGQCGHVAAEEELTFAVVPQFEQRKLFAIWKPVVDELARRSGVKLNLVATLTVAEFERELAKGKFDFVYANPYQIMRESRRQGYIPLVRDDIPLEGIVVVREGSPIRNVAELDGKTLAVPSPNALGASLLIRADLDNLFHVRMKVVSVKTHSSVYLNVATGAMDAGGGVQKTLEEQDASLRSALRILYRTRSMPSHPIAAHPRVPEAIREAIRKAVLGLAATQEGRAMLADVPMTRPVAASIQDYLPMQNWGLERYWVEEAK